MTHASESGAVGFDCLPATAYQLLISFHCSDNCFHCTSCRHVWFRLSSTFLQIRSIVGAAIWPSCITPSRVLSPGCQTGVHAGFMSPLVTSSLTVTLFWADERLPLLTTTIPWHTESRGRRWESRGIRVMAGKVEQVLGLYNDSLFSTLSPLRSVNRIASSALCPKISVSFHADPELCGLVWLEANPQWRLHKSQLEVELASESGSACPGCLRVLRWPWHTGTCQKCHTRKLCQLCIGVTSNACVFCAGPLDVNANACLLRLRGLVLLG